MTQRASILIACTEDFKTAAETYAQKEGISLSELIRRSVASTVGFDFSKSKVDDKRRKYENDEARYKAYLDRRKRERDAVNKLLSALAHEQLVLDRNILKDSLTRKGVSVEDV